MRCLMVAILLSGPVLVSTCGGTTSKAAPGSSDSGTPDSGTPISGAFGGPCTPEEEFNPRFPAFDVHEVTVEAQSLECATHICLVNHFQGRVSCPYGQAVDGSPRQGATAECADNNPLSGRAPGCCTPGIPQAVTGPLSNNMPVDLTTQQTVPGQCTQRTADKAVYCSCRCANVGGTTNDGATYCTCPGGYSCTQLPFDIGVNGPLSGAYCIKGGTQYDPNQSCTACDPAIGGCGQAQWVAQ
jgi:hypothetical protein